jgi:hypothetical protein
MQELARLQDDRVPVGPVLLDLPGPAEINGTLKGGFAMLVEHCNDLVLNSPVFEFKPTCLFIRLLGQISQLLVAHDHLVHLLSVLVPCPDQMSVLLLSLLVLLE